MNIFKPIFSAFIVGGLLAVVGQVFMNIFIALGVEPGLTAPLTLVAMGVIGGGLFIVGIYQKIEKVGAFGAILPFSGFAAAVAGVFAGTKKQTNSSGKASKAAIMLVLYVAGIGTILSFIVGAVALYTM
mgnify:CR=1 FL=1